jgi:hypothetical protein
MASCFRPGTVSLVSHIYSISSKPSNPFCVDTRPAARPTTTRVPLRSSHECVALTGGLSNAEFTTGSSAPLHHNMAGPPAWMDASIFNDLTITPLFHSGPQTSQSYSFPSNVQDGNFQAVPLFEASQGVVLVQSAGHQVGAEQAGDGAAAISY